MIDKIQRNIEKLMRHYGLGDAEASVMAALSTHGKMTAREISEKTGYAYSTIINSLNYLRRRGLVERRKGEGRKSTYHANVDFIHLIENERKKILHLVGEIKNDFKKLEDNSKLKLHSFIKKIDDFSKYLKGGG